MHTNINTHYHVVTFRSIKKFRRTRSTKERNIQMIFPVVWNASSTVPSSWSDAARRKTLNMFFQPERILCAWEFTIWAMQRTTISRIVGDLVQTNYDTNKIINNNIINSITQWTATAGTHNTRSKINMNEPELRENNIIIHGNLVNHIDEFVYHGSVIHSSCYSSYDITCCCAPTQMA